MRIPSEMKKYLVLGGNGFIGKNLCHYLLEKEVKVDSFDVLLPSNINKDVNYIQGDFFDDSALKSLVNKYDVIYHAISTINPGNSNEKYLHGYGQDFLQTIKLCSWIKDSNKKIIFLSSGGTVYGKQEIQPITEDMLPKPINHYGNVKLSIENALRIFHIQNNMNVRIARISNPYGPGQDYTRGVGFVDAALKRSIQGMDVEVWGDGETIRDYIYIEDVCSLLYELSLYEGDESVFNLSSGIGISQKEVVNDIMKLGIGIKINYKKYRSVDVEKVVLDNSKILSLTGIKLTTFDEGLGKYYKYLIDKKS